MGFTTITRTMTVDSIIAIKKIDAIIDKYIESIEWLEEKYPSRLDLIQSLKCSVIRISHVRKDLILLDTKIDALQWMQN